MPFFVNSLSARWFQWAQSGSGCYRHASTASETPVTWAATTDDDEHFWDISAICSGTETPWKVWNDWISNTASYTCCWITFLVLVYSIVCWSKPRISISFNSVVWSRMERIINLQSFRIDRSSSRLIHTPSIPSSDMSSMLGISKMSSNSANLKAFWCLLVLVSVLGDLMSSSNRESQEESWNSENGGILRLFQRLKMFTTTLALEKLWASNGIARSGVRVRVFLSWFCHVEKSVW